MTEGQEEDVWTRKDTQRDCKRSHEKSLFPLKKSSSKVFKVQGRQLLIYFSNL